MCSSAEPIKPSESKLVITLTYVQPMSFVIFALRVKLPGVLEKCITAIFYDDESGNILKAIYTSTQITES